MRAFLYLTFAIFALALTACDDGEVDGRDDRRIGIMEETFEPGAEWTYEKSVFEDDGFAWEPDTTKMRIVRDTSYAGERHIFYEVWGKGLDPDDEIETIIKSDGYYAWSDDGEDGFRRIMKFPIIKGETYEVTPGHFLTAVELSKTITVPAGIFDCIVFKTTRSSSDNYGFIYASEKYGFVLDEEFWKDDNGNFYLAHKQTLLSVNF